MMHYEEINRDGIDQPIFMCVQIEEYRERRRNNA